jgi:hypothetical protein
MPKQHMICGRLVPRIGSHPLTLALGLVALVAFALILSLTTASSSATSLPTPAFSIPKAEDLAAKYDHAKASVANVGDSLSKTVLNPFRQPSHPPPRQKNDEYHGASWWADWKWLSVPFSSSLTLDDDRALLPPLKERPPIYCYYDATVQKPRDEKDAESELLLTWRRAWWAQGFRPVILSAAEAMDNPTYRELQVLDLTPAFKAELMRWLAWETMGGGMLARYTLLPMGPRDDPVLAFLRRGEYPELTSWKKLGSGLFAGQQTEISAAIKAAMEPSTPKFNDDVLASLPSGLLVFDNTPSSLAFYSDEAIKAGFAKVAEANGQSKAKGLRSLNKLINAHIQLAWQNNFPDGIEVLKPFPRHTTAMVSSALDLAELLANCPESPMPSTCPPNMRRCKTCTPGLPSIKISTPQAYRNSTRAFTIGTVPHPWTLAVIDNLRDDFNATWIRTESNRDPWVSTVMKELPAADVSSHMRVMRFKEAVAGDYATAYSLWLTAETDMPKDMGWTFGFAVPERSHDVDGLREHRKPPKTGDNGDQATEESSLTQEMYLLEGAKQIVALARSSTKTKLRASLQAWNLADTEAWKFAKAFQARRTMVRADWEKEESKYSRGSGTEGGRTAWNRWQDSDEEEEEETGGKTGGKSS